MHHGSLRTSLGRPLPRVSPHRAVGPHGECRPGSPTDLQKLGRALAPICEFPRAAIERARTFQCRNHSYGRHGTSNLKECGSASSELSPDWRALRLRLDIPGFQQGVANERAQRERPNRPIGNVLQPHRRSLIGFIIRLAAAPSGWKVGACAADDLILASRDPRQKSCGSTGVTVSVQVPGSEMGEPAFLTELLRHTGCGWPCDVTNVHECRISHGPTSRASWTAGRGTGSCRCTWRAATGAMAS
jgi:hypothetical protein